MRAEEKEKLTAMYEHYNYRCFVCGERATQRAHIIGNTKMNNNIFERDIIDNILNWLPACGLDHNALIDISNDPLRAEVIACIIERIDDIEEARELIENEVRLNIKRKRLKNGR